jgi:hypothetical protein
VLQRAGGGATESLLVIATDVVQAPNDKQQKSDKLLGWVLRDSDRNAWQNFVLMPVPISGSRGGGDDYGRNLQVRW